MKLGICVVYLVEKRDGALLDLHLRQIEKYTSVPYVIYGSAARLRRRFRRKLEAHPRIRICDVPAVRLRGAREHAYYLDRLVPMAIDDGATHVALLNVDSFPVRSGWAEELIGRLSSSCVLAAVKRIEDEDEKPHPSCMLFSRAFYLEYKPQLLLTPEEGESQACRRYLEACRVVADTGIGYGLKIFDAGLHWHSLERTNRAEEHYIIGGVYGDLIFHLGGASRHGRINSRESRLVLRIKQGSRLGRAVSQCGKIAAPLIPERMRRVLLPYLLPSTRAVYAASRDAYENVRRRLLESPEAYLHYLREGRMKLS